MTNPEQNQPEPARTPTSPDTEVRGMSAAKRTALLRYMAILFAVAFLLVLLSYLIQVRNSQTTITQLNETSASALQNAETLQATNRELTEENDRLETELEQAQQALEQAQAETETQREAAAQQARDDVRQAYDLLLSAKRAFDQADKAGFDQAITALTPLKAQLSESALAQLEALTGADFPTRETTDTQTD